MQTKKKEAKLYGKKALILACALTMAATAGVGGTVAWLIAKTAEVTNTFTYGDIDITLEETDTENDDDLTNDIGPDGNPLPTDGDPNTNTYEMVPGMDINKDPKVTVLADSEDSWLFVKLDKSDNFDDFMEYTIAGGWTALPDEAGVYYRQTSWSANDQAFDVLLDNTVTVKDDVTKAALNALDTSSYPTLTVSAYAVQRNASIAAIDTAAEAWALATE